MSNNIIVVQEAIHDLLRSHYPEDTYEVRKAAFTKTPDTYCWVVWDYSQQNMQRCSEGLDTIEDGMLEIAIYSHSKDLRSSGLDLLNNLLFPSGIALQLTVGRVSFRFVTFINGDEVTSNLTGHSTPEIPGILHTYSIRMKVNNE